MAKLGFDIKYKYPVLGDGFFILREPTNKEWNDYKKELVKTNFVNKNNFTVETDINAKDKLFDKICIEVINIEDDKGFITSNDLDRIPARYKQECIMQCIDNNNEEFKKKD